MFNNDNKSIQNNIILKLSIIPFFLTGSFYTKLIKHTHVNDLCKILTVLCTPIGGSLLWVFLYGLVLLWIYALIGFAVYREIHDEASGTFCRNMYECFVAHVHKGLIDGPYNV